MFIILGLLILVVSFVVALVTLLREKKNIENNTNASKIDKVLTTEVVKEVVQVETPLPQDTSKEIEPNLPLELRENDSKVEDFSWKNNQSYDNNIKNEQQKIEEIRLELARIAGEKISKRGNTSVGVVVDSNVSDELVSNKAVVVSKLNGEIPSEVLRLGNKD